ACSFLLFLRATGQEGASPLLLSRSPADRFNRNRPRSGLRSAHGSGCATSPTQRPEPGPPPPLGLMPCPYRAPRTTPLPRADTTILFGRTSIRSIGSDSSYTARSMQAWSISACSYCGAFKARLLVRNVAVRLLRAICFFTSGTDSGIPAL